MQMKSLIIWSSFHFKRVIYASTQSQNSELANFFKNQ